MATQRYVLAYLVWVKDVAYFDVAVLKEANHVWACNLNSNHVVSPCYLFELEIVHALEI
jgi:hypothetical protein